MYFKLFLIFLSLSIRTPKESNPLDYLIDVGVQKQDTLLIKHSWERELGEYYIAREYMFALRYKNFRLKEYYIKDFKNQYNQIDLQYKKKWLSAGYAYRDGNKIIAAINLRNKRSYLNIEGVTDFHVYNIDFKTGVNFEFKKNIFYTNELRYIRTDTDFFQFKIGIKIKL